MRWVALSVLGLVLVVFLILVAVRVGDGPLTGLRIDGERLDPEQPLEAQLQARAQIYGEQLGMIARRLLRDLRNSAAIENR